MAELDHQPDDGIKQMQAMAAMYMCKTRLDDSSAQTDTAELYDQEDHYVAYAAGRAQDELQTPRGP